LDHCLIFDDASGGGIGRGGGGYRAWELKPLRGNVKEEWRRGLSIELVALRERQRMG
jgi:hypothetical protein